MTPEAQRSYQRANDETRSASRESEVDMIQTSQICEVPVTPKPG